VEEPNAHVFLRPKGMTEEIVTLPVPEIDESRCSFCGRCAEICEYNALAVLKDTTLVFEELCHGCGGCSLLCPEEAIREKPRRIGILEKGTRGRIAFVNGRLDVGQAFSPPVIRAVKENLIRDGINLLDAPPGTSCPMVETVKGSDFTILVTEPTPFGLHDLELAVLTLHQMGIPQAVVLNRADLGTTKIREACRRLDVPVWMEIPFHRRIAEAYAVGDSLFSVFPEFKSEFTGLFDKIETAVRRKGTTT